MPLVTTTEMFRKAYEGGYAIGAFNVNNMEIVQGITEAAKEANSPIILQVSAGARKYAKHGYLMKLVEAAVEDTGLPIALGRGVAMELNGVDGVHQFVDGLGHRGRGGDAGVADGEIVHVLRAHFRSSRLGKGKGLADLRAGRAEI